MDSRDSRSDKLSAPILLASASPRRRELLTMLGLSFQVVPAQITEDLALNATPDQYVETLATQKALAVAKQHPEALVIGADTIVVLDDAILGKPSSPEDAHDMLERLSGRTHHVFTGLCLTLHGRGRVKKTHVTTAVTFDVLSPQKIARYVRTGEPMDKAGAYGIQGLGATLVKEIKGCYFNVVGLPLYTLANMMAPWGYEVP